MIPGVQHAMLTLLLLFACGAAPSAPPAAPRSPQPTASPPTSPGITAAQLEGLAAVMQAQSGTGFHVVISSPYVVAGDGPPAEVERRAKGTVAWAHRQLRGLFFDHDPSAPVAVWLFHGPDSYQTHVREWVGEDPGTPYGFANPDGLFMDITTGGGTLIHELVHPLVAANWADCPPWINEGLGSLYEAVTERDGRMHGLLNWRLPGLQQALRDEAALPFDDLLAMQEDAFYADDTGVAYAQSRYLMYYLQEHGLLVRFFRTWRAQADRDPTGAVALKTVLGTPDLAAFQVRWSAWVLALDQQG